MSSNDAELPESQDLDGAGGDTAETSGNQDSAEIEGTGAELLVREVPEPSDDALAQVLSGSQRRGRTTPIGVLTMRALRPTILVLLLWMFLSAVTYWVEPQVTVTDAIALTYNGNRFLGALLGLALVLGALNLASSTVPAFRHGMSTVLRPLTAPWQRLPLYVKRQWGTFLKIVLVVVGVFVLLGLLRTGTAWNQINAGIAGIPLQIPQYALLAFVYIGATVGGFLMLFFVLSRGGVTTLLPEDIKTSLDQVWGQDQVVDRIRETIGFLQYPDLIEKHGGHVPSGVLLWGPPGTGKTLIAEAIAGETGTPFVLVEPGAFQNMFVGIGVLRVKVLYRKLRKLSDVYGGVVVFFDEADVLGSRGAVGSRQNVPGTSGMCSSERQLAHYRTSAPAPEDSSGVNRVSVPVMGGGDLGVLNAILAAMQGVNNPKRGLKYRVRRMFGLPPGPAPKVRILHIMATNMPSSLDPALLRPGRIDRLFRVGHPSKEGRERTFRGYLDKVAHELTDAQIRKLAEITPNATGATIKDIVNESVIDALRQGRTVVTYQDVLNAKRFKEFGPPEGVEYQPFERHAVAVHEACHAVAAWKIRHHLTIDTVTIEKGQDFLGMVSSVPAEDSYTKWRSQYLSDMTVALASLAGERYFFEQDTTSGVVGDLEAATAIASSMVGRWGMGEAISSQPVLLETGMTSGRDRSSEVEAVLDEAYLAAKELVETERDRILCLAHALEVHRTLTGMDVQAMLEHGDGILVSGRHYDSVEARAAVQQYHQDMLNGRGRSDRELPDPHQVLPQSNDLTLAPWPGEDTSL